jgi:glutamate synthase (NADPH/NADH) small chain
MKELSTRERMQIPRQAMPVRNPAERRRDFEEVALGLTPELAEREAMRCILCKRPPCIEGCPVRVRIDQFIPLVASGDLAGAARILAADNALPAVCGRVCPQETQCEELCVLGRKGLPVAIGALERYVAGWAREHDAGPQAPAAPTGHRIAVVGAGPAGLTCASDLARLGHEVTIFEALHEPGGVLAYGIPRFRLPRDIVASEIRGLTDLGVEIVTDAVIGMAESIDDLLAGGYDAVFLGVGAGLPRFLDIPGEDLVGVYSANEFLTRVNLMKAHQARAATPVIDLEGVRVAVFGGGNTAVDAARTAVRLGAAEVAMLYRRTCDEMPARVEEIEHALEEGVLLTEQVAPVELTGTDGRLEGVRLLRMAPGDPDESGRRRPVEIPGSEFDLPVDLAVVAIGNAPNPILRRTTADLEHTRWGTLVVDPDTGETRKPGVWAGGDIVTGGATVILAMGAGRRAAAAIHARLCGVDPGLPTTGNGGPVR